MRPPVEGLGLGCGEGRESRRRRWAGEVAVVGLEAVDHGLRRRAPERAWSELGQRVTATRWTATTGGERRGV